MVERPSIPHTLAYIRRVTAVGARQIFATLSDSALQKLLLKHTLRAAVDDPLRLAVERATTATTTTATQCSDSKLAADLAPVGPRVPWPLPTSVVFRVTQWCDVTTMMRLYRVSRAFQDVAQNPLAWCGRLVLDRAPVSELVSLKRLVSRALERVTQLDTTSRRCHTPLSTLGDHFSAEAPSRLHTLRMRGQGSSVLVSKRLALQATVYPQLARLACETSHFHVVPLMIAELSALTHLHLYWRSSASYLSVAPVHLEFCVPARLVSLRLRGMAALIGGGYAGPVKARHAVTFAPSSQLATLHMRDVALRGLPSSITDIAVSGSLSATVPRSADPIDPAVFSRHFSPDLDALAFMPLRRLSLDGFRLPIPEEWAGVLRSHAARLERLRLRACNVGWHSGTAFAVIGGMERLEHLRIDHLRADASPIYTTERLWHDLAIARRAHSNSRLRVVEVPDGMRTIACVPPVMCPAAPKSAMSTSTTASADKNSSLLPPPPPSTVNARSLVTATPGAARNSLLDDGSGVVVDALVTKRAGLGGAVGCILFPSGFAIANLHFRTRRLENGLRHYRVRVRIVHADIVELLVGGGCVVRVGDTRWRDGRHHYSVDDARCRRHYTTDGVVSACYCAMIPAEMRGDVARVRSFDEILSPLR